MGRLYSEHLWSSREHVVGPTKETGLAVFHSTHPPAARAFGLDALEEVHRAIVAALDGQFGALEAFNVVPLATRALFAP
jgi:hypothetical protein